MSFIVYQTDPRTGYQYAYQVESFRDPNTKKPRSRRTYLGKVDSTGAILPKGTNGRRNRGKKESGSHTPSAESPNNGSPSYEDIKCENKVYVECLTQIKDLIEKALEHSSVK